MSRYRYNRLDEPRPMSNLDIAWHLFVALGLPISMCIVALSDRYSTADAIALIGLYAVCFVVTVTVNYVRDRRFQKARHRTESRAS